MHSRFAISSHGSFSYLNMEAATDHKSYKNSEFAKTCIKQAPKG